MGLIWIRKDSSRMGLLDQSNQHIYATYREVKKRKGGANTFRVEGYAQREKKHPAEEIEWPDVEAAKQACQRIAACYTAATIPSISS
ncbi:MULTISPECIES: hypothetical protein [Microvirga]|uniref:hypothetical protein n=1 Tax=Microvirga TaxID=186650 RepID=UPI0021C63BFE|nr:MULTISPECIES: hypothetical protein [unclassified Microvirga]